MNSQHAARQLSRYGRHGDNNLVHVSDRELQGIEQLTGRRFTRNPDTGLPEAFNFADLIPVAAGIGATVLTGGNPLAGAAAAGATRTGVSAAQGKDAGSALMDGLVAGATSYATAGITDGVLGAPSVTDAQIGSQISQGINNAGLTQGYDATGQMAGTIGASVAPPSAGSPTPDVAANLGAGSAGNFLPPAPAAPETGFNRLVSNINASPGRALTALGGTAMQLSGMMSPTPMPGEPEYQGRPENFPSSPRTLRMPGPGYRPGVDPEFRYFAAGGLAALPTRSVPQYNDALNVVSEARAAMLGEHPARKDAMRRLGEQMGPDAVQAVREEGGRVRGAGGGLDDLVPGTIEGRQQVRLADGEFVVPADVVSALGDGSTDQGARKLHEMMNRVRQQKTGSTKQPGRISDEVFPA